jgi:Fe2+ transport system protein FeoA
MNKTLRDFAIGAKLVVRGFQDTLAPDLRGHLSAWGLTPGTPITLLAQRPVTRIAVEHAELALEDIIANAILVEEPPPA